jgi:hypothetical protein
MSEKTYGLIAEFDSPGAVLRAAEAMRGAGYRRWDVFSPFPVHGLEKVMGFKNSKVGAFSLLFGAGAFLGTLGLLWYCNAFDYPILIGGKPMFSTPMSVVPAYILLVLGAALGAFIGMIALNQLPRHHHPLFGKKRFELVSRDKFFLVVGAQDEKFSATETRQWLEFIGGTNVELVEDPD